MGPRILIEVAIALFLLSALVARADVPYSQPSSAPAKPAATAPNPVPTTLTPNSSSGSSSRTPAAMDPNTYHSNGGGFSVQGSPQNKEPVIDGKSIPKTIDFSTGGNTEPAAKPAPKTLLRKPTKKSAVKPRRGRGGADKSSDSSQEDDGL